MFLNMALGRKRHHIFKVPASGSPSDNLLNSFEIMNIPSSLPYRWNNSFKWWWTAIKMYSYLTSQSFSITFNCTQYITVLHLRGQYISYFNPETLKKKNRTTYIINHECCYGSAYLVIWLGLSLWSQENEQESVQWWNKYQLSAGAKIWYVTFKNKGHLTWWAQAPQSDLQVL